MSDTTTNTELTTEDIQKLITEAENEQFKKLQAININIGERYKIELDVQSGKIFIISVISWIIIWYVFNIFKIVKYANFFFWSYIIVSFINFYNSATNVADAETERININSQQSFIQGGLSIFILAFVFLSNINIEENQKISVYIVLVISLIICTVGIILINIKNTSSNIRFVRKLQQTIFNQSTILFMLGLFMIYMYKTKIKNI